MVRAVRKVFPVSNDFDGRHWFTRIDGVRHATPIFVCLAAIVAADIAFAIDSIPAAFAITRDSVLIWMANIFALLGLRALFVLVEGLIRRFRYLDETIAVVLALVAVKLLLEDTYKVGHVASLAVVAVAFTIGIVASVRGRQARGPGRGVIVRRAAAGDVPAIAGLLGELGYPVPDDRLAARLERLPATTTVLVADDGGVVGLAALDVRSPRARRAARPGDRVRGRRRGPRARRGTAAAGRRRGRGAGRGRARPPRDVRRAPRGRARGLHGARLLGDRPALRQAALGSPALERGGRRAPAAIPAQHAHRRFAVAL